MIKVKLRGRLGKRFGKEFRLDISSPAEAIRALCSQFRDFEAYIRDQSSNGVYWRVVTEDPKGLDEDELHYPVGSNRQVTISPQVSGAGNFGKILLGAALIGAAFLIPGGVFGISGTTIGLFGGALALQGASGILSPKQKTPKESERRDSHLIDRGADVGRQGTPVSVLYGKRYCTDFVVVSSGVTVNEVPV